jgi:hypothetical protein
MKVQQPLGWASCVMLLAVPGAAGAAVAATAARPTLPQQTVTWLYTEDLERGSTFLGDVLSWHQVLDQGSCRIFRSGRDSFVGVCDSRPPPTGGEMAPVTYTLVLPTRAAVDDYYQALAALGEERVQPTVPQYSERFNVYSMFFYDPDPTSLGLYRFEVQTFEDPSWPIPSGSPLQLQPMLEP